MIVWNLVSSCLTILPIAEGCYYKWELMSIIHNITEQANSDVRFTNKFTLEDHHKLKGIKAALDKRPRQVIHRGMVRDEIRNMRTLTREFKAAEIENIRTVAQEKITAATKKHNEKSLITKPLGVLGFAMLAAGKVWQIFMQN